jgi:hypothetical protein
MSKQAFQVRQGDVFIEQVEPPKNLGDLVARDRGAIVLAYGESSGHRHQLTAKGAKLFQRGSTRMLEISARGGAVLAVTSDHGASLTPERHEPITIPPGVHEVISQREYAEEDVVKAQD